MNDHEDYMREAMKEADRSVESGNGPFSVVVVDPQGEIVWRDHDRQNEKCDPTAHSEMNAIHYLCPTLQTKSLKGFAFYTTSEPCPHCLSGMIKAQVSYAYFGAPTEKSASLPISAFELAKYATKYPIKVVGGILEKECLEQRENFFKTARNK